MNALVARLRQQWKPLLGYAGFFLACFIVFGFITFPWSLLRGRATAACEQALTGYRCDIESISPSIFLGANLEGVRLQKSAIATGEEGSSIHIDELSVRWSPFAYLLGATKISFDASVGDGSIEGFVEEGTDYTDMEIEIDAVSLKRVAPLKSQIGLPADGQVEGVVALHLTEKPEDTTGNLSLRIANLTVGDGRSKLKIGMLTDGITVETIRAGNMSAIVEVEKGVAEIKKFESKGADLEITVSGDAKLNRPASRSRLNLLTAIRFTDAYKKKSDRTKGMFALLDAAPQFASARTADGGLQYRISGALGGQIIPRPAGRERVRKPKAPKDAKPAE